MSAQNFVTYLFLNPSTWHNAYHKVIVFIRTYFEICSGILFREAGFMLIRHWRDWPLLPWMFIVFPFNTELSARRCEAWANHSNHPHNYQSSCFDKSVERGPHQPLRCPRRVIVDWQHNWSALILLSFDSANLQLCLLSLPILYWFLKLHSPLRSSLHRRL